MPWLRGYTVIHIFKCFCHTVNMPAGGWRNILVKFETI